MLEFKFPVEKNRLEVTPAPVKIIFADDGMVGLSAILPPLQDLREIRMLSEMNYSLSQISSDNYIRLRDSLKLHLRELLEKEDRFGSSPTFLAHVADVHEMLGEITEAQIRLQVATNLSSNPLLRHRLGAGFVALGKMTEARSIFNSMDLLTDVQANLRLAYLFARENRLDHAIEAVDSALDISTIDFGARLFRGALALAKGDILRAIQNFKFALEDRISVAALTNLAICYILIRRPDKAFAALKKAVALEPYSENAVGILADLAFLEKRNELAIGSLERFVEFEQKSAAGWERLARALMELGQKRKAVEALKRQASVQETSHVFNNLGVAYERVGDHTKAMQYFRHAMEFSKKENPSAGMLPSRNLLSVLCQVEDFDAARHLAKSLLKLDPYYKLAEDDVLSDIYAFYIVALVRTGEQKEAIRFSKRILQEAPRLAPGLRVWIGSSLVAELGLSPDKAAEALTIGQAAIEESKKLDVNDPRRLVVHNNMAFLLLELGDLTEAEKHLAQISKYIHTDPFATATLGLLHFKRGSIDKAKSLYEEAKRLAVHTMDRHRIAQKLNYELGCALFEKDPRQSRRFLSIAAKDSEPIAQIRDKAKQMLLSIDSRRKLTSQDTPR